MGTGGCFAGLRAIWPGLTACFNEQSSLAGAGCPANGLCCSCALRGAAAFRIEDVRGALIVIST